MTTELILPWQVDAEELAAIIRQSCGNAPYPHLLDPAARERARAQAEAQGFFARFEQELDPAVPIPVLRRSDFRAYARTGDRGPYQRYQGERARRINLAAMACYFGFDYLDYLQDLLWAECETNWWIMPAHEYVNPIDLWATMAAERYAVILTVLGDRMEEEVRERLRAEIDRRVLAQFLDPATDYFWWRHTTNNWNAVCHGGVAIAAMLIERDPDRLARILTRALTDLAPFLDGFTGDGGCTEGPSYWRYGFGWYVKLAAALYDFTNGRLNLMAGEKLARVSRYPLAVNMAPGEELTFADAHAGFQSLETVCQINRFVAASELFGLCRLREDGRPVAQTLEDLLLYNGPSVAPLVDPRDYLLADLGVVKLKMGQVTLGTKAGHNNEHHNHNDIGSFIVHRGGSQFLCDPGAPIYSAKTFSDRRYESAFTNSFGHSVPVVNGSMQSPGQEYAGALAVDGMNSGAIRHVRIEMAGAYAVPSLSRLTREFTVPASGEILLADTFTFTGVPSSVEEAFITTLPAETDADGVLITSSADGTARLRALTPGRFQVVELPEESKESPHGQLLRRITFAPEKLEKEMVVRFGISLA